MGGEIAKIAEGNQWEGIIVNGCIRDTNEMRWCGLKIPVLAVGTSPVPSSKRDPGVKDPKFGVTFGGVNFKSGSWVYADCDGVLVTREKGPLV
jgi:regulator of ribonuclease activity A